jgi:hypothetical protein
MADKKTKETNLPDHGLAIMALQLSVKFLASDLEQIKRRMERWDEVYYYVFPDRLEQDVKFESQLLDLTKAQKPDTDKKE